MTDEKILSMVANAILNDVDAVYIIDKSKREYQRLKADSFWDKRLGENGSIKELYEALLLKNKENDEKVESSYSVFDDESLFLRDKYSGYITIFDSGETKEFILSIRTIADKMSAVYLNRYEYNELSNKAELQKIDAIQENYLFSMIIDLKNDLCINCNTTEISANRQDFMDIKYSEWRMMISNMFMNEDKSVFLRMSSPEYVINNLEEKNSFKLELKMMNMQGQYIWSRLTFTRMKGFSRQNPMFVYTVQDINQDMLRLLNQENIITEVETKNQMLQEADKAKTMFISNMSHEIRTPINAVIGMNDIIIREAKDEKILSYAYDVKNASKVLLSIVNDILDYSKIESGKMEIIPVEYSTVSLFNDIRNLVSFKAKEKELDLIFNISSELPVRLYGDEIRITQIVINLLTNAIKYTEEGKVTLTVSHVSDDSGRADICVVVEDTGIGMKQEEMSRLFEAFQRLDVEHNRKIEGTGLGMSIVVKLLEQMGSRLEVSSEYGKGSRFSFVLSQKVVDSSAIGDFSHAVVEMKNKQLNDENRYVNNYAKILLVDDNAMNLRVALSLLKPTGVSVEFAKSGKACLELVKNRKYDMILLDHLMPEMDGIETLSKLKQMDNGRDVPVIALTANVMSGARDMYIGHGFTDFLEKPIEFEKLINILKTYIK